MKQFMILFKKDFMELFRTKKILIISIVFIIFALASPIITQIIPNLITEIQGVKIEMPEATIIDSYGQFISNIIQICSFTLIIALGSSIVKERKSGLYNNLLNNGVKKRNFILSKVSVQILMVSAIYIVSVMLFSAYNYILFDNFFVKYSFVSLLSIYIYLIFLITVINFFSTISRSTIMSIILSFAFIFIIMLFDLFAFGKYLPNYLINIAYNIFSDSTLLQIFYKNIAITLLLSIVIVMMSIKLCKNKE